MNSLFVTHHTSRTAFVSCSICGRVPALAVPRLRQRQRHVAVSAERKFNEGAAQVKRLLKRDRSAVPDLDKPDSFSSENDAGEDLTANDPTPSSSVGTGPSAKVAFAKAAASPFGSSIKSPLKPASPFGSTTEKPFREFNELSPDMDMAPINEDDVWWKNITVTQVVIALTFVFSIVLMLATFFVVWKMGAIRLNDT